MFSLAPSSPFMQCPITALHSSNLPCALHLPGKEEKEGKKEGRDGGRKGGMEGGRKEGWEGGRESLFFLKFPIHLENKSRIS